MSNLTRHKHKQNTYNHHFLKPQTLIIKTHTHTNTQTIKTIMHESNQSQTWRDKQKTLIYPLLDQSQVQHFNSKVKTNNRPY